MPYSLSLHGGKKRFAYSKASESAALATWGGTPATMDRLLCYTNASQAIGNAAYELLDNANACEGQSELPTRLVKGPHKKMATPEFWCTPEAWGRFVSSLSGSDTFTTADISAKQHLFSPSTEPVPFTVQDHHNGFEDLDFASHYSGVWVNTLRLKISKGSQYATLSPELVLSKNNDDAGVTYPVDALEALDVAATLPNKPGMAPGKFRLTVSPTAHPHTSRFTAATWPAPTTQGRPPNHNLAGSAVEVGLYCDDIELEIFTGVVLEDTLRAGFAAGAGVNYGKPYALARGARLTLSADVRNATFTKGVLRYFQDITDAAQTSWAAQLLGVGDTLVGATYYEMIGWVGNAMRIDSLVTPNSGTDTQKMSITFSLMQAAASAALWEAVSIDDINQDYVA